MSAWQEVIPEGWRIDRAEMDDGVWFIELVRGSDRVTIESPNPARIVSALPAEVAG